MFLFPSLFAYNTLLLRFCRDIIKSYFRMVFLWKIPSLNVQHVSVPKLFPSLRFRKKTASWCCKCLKGTPINYPKGFPLQIYPKAIGAGFLFIFILAKLWSNLTSASFCLKWVEKNMNSNHLLFVTFSHAEKPGELGDFWPLRRICSRNGHASAYGDLWLCR